MQLGTVDVWKAFWRVFLIAASIIGLFWVGTANSATQCGSYDRMVQVLADKFGETPKANGTVSSKRIMQAFVSIGGSWTILVTRSDGYACIVIAGQDWEDVPFEPGQKS